LIKIPKKPLPPDDEKRERAAVLALCAPAPGKKPDPALLGEILRGDRPISPALRLILAHLIDPASQALDVKLIPKFTSARTRQDARRAKYNPTVAVMVTELRAGASVEAAAEANADRHGVSGRTVIKYWVKARRGPLGGIVYGRHEPFTALRPMLWIIKNILSKTTP
jgi:hypothetical protein